MQIIRTIVWVLVVVALGLFSLNNWNPVEIKIWEGLILETKLPALVMASFLLGLAPMWLLAKAGKWRLNRRINALENSVRANASAPPLATSRLSVSSRIADCVGSSASAACVSKLRPSTGGRPGVAAAITIRPGIAPATKPSRAALCCT